MKVYSTKLIVSSIIIALFFTACNKNSSLEPATQTVNADMVSSLIALNLTQSLAGSYGGFDVKRGVNAPAFATKGSTQSINGFNSLNSTTCGFLADSVANYDTNIGDTIKSHTAGSFKFFFNCSYDEPMGYDANDFLTTTGKAPSYSFVYVLTQYFQLTSLDLGRTLLSVNGNLKSDVNLTYNNPSVKPTVVKDYYVLSNLNVDLLNNGDITSGSATFTSTGSNNSGTWSFSGNIVFLGNHKADIIIEGKTYHADLLTGKVS